MAVPQEFAEEEENERKLSLKCYKRFQLKREWNTLVLKGRRLDQLKCEQLLG